MSGRHWVLVSLATAALLLDWGATLWLGAAPIERDLTRRTGAALAEAGFAWARIAIDGRSITLSGIADNAEARTAALRDLIALPDGFEAEILLDRTDDGGAAVGRGKRPGRR